MTRTVVTIGWLFDGLTKYQSTVPRWYLPAYILDNEWQ